jgi:hypothetical protein
MCAPHSPARWRISSRGNGVPVRLEMGAAAGTPDGEGDAERGGRIGDDLLEHLLEGLPGRSAEQAEVPGVELDDGTPELPFRGAGSFCAAITGSGRLRAGFQSSDRPSGKPSCRRLLRRPCPASAGRRPCLRRKHKSRRPIWPGRGVPQDESRHCAGRRNRSMSFRVSKAGIARPLTDQQSQGHESRRQQVQ